LWVTIAVTTAGASFQFYSNGAINTPQRIVESWMNETYARRNGYAFGSSTLTFLWSLAVGAPSIGAMIGSLITSHLAETYGRKRSLMINGFITLAGGAFEATCKWANSPEMFIVGRFLLGLANGVASGMVPLFLTEIASVEKRGAAGTAHQIVVAFADWFSLCVTLPQLLGSQTLWPVAFAFPAIPALIMVAVLPFIEETPRYLLMTKQDSERAKKAVRFYASSDQEYRATFEGLVREAASSTAYSGKSWRDMLRKRELRTPLLISVVVMTAQQFTGIAAVFSYSTNIFEQVGTFYVT
jgi:SP family facilitated glucose transporter-like MFS transporter 1